MLKTASVECSEQLYPLLWESLYTEIPTAVPRNATAEEKADLDDALAAAQMSKLQQLYSIHVTICKLLWYSGIDFTLIQQVLQGQLKSLMMDAFTEKRLANRSSTAATVFPRFFSTAKAFPVLDQEQRDRLYMTNMYFLTVSFPLDSARFVIFMPSKNHIFFPFPCFSPFPILNCTLEILGKKGPCLKKKSP